MTINKNTTMYNDLPTTTATKWPTSCFSSKNIFSKKKHLKLLGQIPWVTPYKNTKLAIEKQQQQQQIGQLPVLLKIISMKQD